MSFTHDRRVVLYPHYITASKTVAEGRRIPKELACDNPNVLEMLEAVKELKLQAIIEDKHYPRDWFIRCRLRVEWKTSNGIFLNPDISDRRTLLVKIAELVPKYKRSLPQNAAVAAPTPSSDAAGSSSSSGSATATSSKAGNKSTTTNNKKKKGK